MSRTMTMPLSAAAGPKRATIRLELLRREKAVQSRAALDGETVEAYAELMKEAVEFPPLSVFDDGESLWLSDGFHRAAAAERDGLEEFPCEVQRGTRRDAILHSVGANARHGLKLSDADKRRAVRRLLEDGEWSKWSNREVARRCGVSKSFVDKMRRRVSPEAAGARLARRGSQVYEMTPGNSARAAPEAPPPDYVTGWLYYLVRFTPAQFVRWQRIVRGRTQRAVLAEAVDVVMREAARAE